MNWGVAQIVHFLLVDWYILKTVHYRVQSFPSQVCSALLKYHTTIKTITVCPMGTACF